MITPFNLKRNKRSFCSNNCRNQNIGRFVSGPNNALWDHSKSQEEREKGRKIEGVTQWRNAIYKRDNYTCQCCGDDRGGNLQAHHILNYSEHPSLRLALVNGICLCESCHKEFHDTFGYTGNNAKQLLQFLGHLPIDTDNIFQLLEFLGF